MFLSQIATWLQVVVSRIHERECLRTFKRFLCCSLSHRRAGTLYWFRLKIELSLVSQTRLNVVAGISKLSQER